MHYDNTTLREKMVVFYCPSLLPVVGLVVIFLLFNFLTGFRMMGNMALAFASVYVTMISAMGVFFIMTMGGLDFSQGSILGISSIVVCGFQVQYSACNPCRYCVGSYHWCNQRLLLCIPQDQIFHCNNLYDVPVPRIHQVSYNKRTGCGICKADQL